MAESDTVPIYKHGSYNVQDTFIEFLGMYTQHSLLIMAHIPLCAAVILLPFIFSHHFYFFI